MSERLDAAWAALTDDLWATIQHSHQRTAEVIADHRLAIEAEARADAHLHDGCFQRGTLTADYIEKQRAEARADALAKVEGLSPGYIKKGDGFEPTVSLAALRAILAERQP